MTDLVTGQTQQTDAPPPASNSGSGGSDAPELQWAPSEPAPKKRHTALWIAIPSSVVAIAAAVAAIVLIAPGTAVAGVPIGGMTAGGAADAIASRLANTQLEITTPNGTATITGADLGATVNAEALANEAYSASPMWNVTQWNAADINADITVDQATADAALRSALGGDFTDPTDAVVTFDAGSANYTFTPAVDGEGLDIAAVEAALAEAFASGTGTLDTAPAVVEADITTAEAEAAVTNLNGMLDTIGFYVGDERTVPVDRAVAASWLSVGTADGAITLSADADAIEGTVGSLAEAVNRAPVNAEAITNSSGDVLEEVVAGQTGREIGDTANVANDFAAQLAAGNAKYELSVTETQFETTGLFRRADVNLSTQTATFYENDQVVQTFLISSGLGENATPTGNFAVFAHVPMQDMGCGPTSSYCTKDVPWVTYFSPDIGFHGTYWHNNFGQPMSHGCLNLPIDQAKWVYDFVKTGTEVSVHY